MKRLTAFFLTVALLLPHAIFAARAEAPPAEAEPSFCCGTDRAMLQEMHGKLVRRKNAELQARLGADEAGSDDPEASLFGWMPTFGYDNETPSLMRSTGTVNMLVIPIVYSDYPKYKAEFDREATYQQFFAPYDPDPNLAASSQSVRGYYHWLSYGKLEIVGDVMEAYEAPYPSAYYHMFGNSLDGLNSSRVDELVEAALQYHVDRGVDLSRFDGNGDGYLDAVVFKSMRPGDVSYTFGRPLYAAGFRAESFVFMSLSEVQSLNDGSVCESYSGGTLVAEHEIGHLMGLDDNYIEGSYRNFLDDDLYEKMAHGGFFLNNYYNVHYKYLLGWIDPVILTEYDPVSEMTLSAVEAHAEDDASGPMAVVLIPNARAFPFTEYYIAEYRNGGYTPGPNGSKTIFTQTPGLVIWHVNAALNMYGQYKYKTNYVQPVYKSGTTPYSAKDVYVAGDEFSSATTPSSDFYDGAQTGAYLQVVALAPEKATIRVGFQDPPHAPEPVIEVSAPTKKAIRTGESSSIVVTMKVGDELLPMDGWPPIMDHVVLTGTVEHSYQGSAQKNPYTITVPGHDLDGITGDGTVYLDIPAGTIQYQGKDSAAVVSEVIYVDNTPPEIALLGPDPLTVWLGERYQDPGARATDNLDPEIADKLVMDASGLDMNTPGTYTVSYRVTDHAGHTATAERTVQVVERSAHVHNYSADWSFDAANHWRVCGCTDRSDIAAHVPVVDPAVPPTCAVDGKAEGSHCAICGYVISSDVIPATGRHIYARELAYNERRHWRKCENCDSVEGGDNHHEDNGTVGRSPTQADAWIKTYACSDCGYVMRTETLSQLELLLLELDPDPIPAGSALMPFKLGTSLEEIDAALESHTVYLGLDGWPLPVASTFQLLAEDNLDYDPLIPGIHELKGRPLLDDPISNPDDLCVRVYINVKAYTVASTRTTILTRPVGTAFEDLELPSVVTVTRSDHDTDELPVTWSAQGYDPTKVGKQIISGTLDTPLPVYLTNPDNRQPKVLLTLEKQAHTHIYSQAWTSDETDHWHECKCGDRADVAAHTPVTNPAIPATCTASGKREGSHCEVCGYVILPQATIPATGHSYSGDWTADETDHWLQCANCDAVDRRAAHTEDNGTVTTAPTLEMEGVKTYACSVCGYVMRTETLPRLEPGHSHTYAENWTWDAAGHWHECGCGEKSDQAEHIPVTDPAIPATCTEDGKTEGSHCQACGYIILPQATALATGHSYSADWTADETGHWHKCENCDGITDVVEHTPVVDPAVPVTCTKDGITEGSHCKVCGYVIVPQVTIPALGHVYLEPWRPIPELNCHLRKCDRCNISSLGAHVPVEDPPTPATCTQSGREGASHCEVCGGVVKYGTSIPATGHRYQFDTWTGVEEGHGNKCANCDDITRITAHVPVVDPAVPPTHTTEGKTEGSHCLVCGYVIRAQTAIPTACASGHRYSGWTPDKTAHWRSCEVCGSTDMAVHVPVVTTSAIRVTCTRDGRTAGSHCYVCGYVIQVPEVIPALGTEHKYSTEWAYNQVTHGHNCEKCGSSQEGTWAVHVPVTDPAVPATCTTDGQTEGNHCEVCGYAITPQTVVPATGHSYSANWTGVETGHGHQCADCGDVANVVAHTVVMDPAFPATCTADGRMGDGSHCSECGYVIKRATVIPATGHNCPPEWVSNKTMHWHNCETCGKTDMASIAAHVPVTTPAISATCTTDGKTEGSHCGVCGYVITAQVTIPATGHHYAADWSSDETDHWHACACGERGDRAAHTEGTGTVTQAPTLEETGTKTYACSVCGYVMRAETLPKLEPEHTHNYGQNWTSDETGHWHECDCGDRVDAAAHAPAIDPAIEATCTTDGKTAGSHCDICGYVITARMTVPATGHHYGQGWKMDETGHWHACESCDSATDRAAHSYGDWTTVQVPTATAEGSETRGCTACGYAQTQAIPPLGFDFSVTGWQFRDAFGTLCNAPVDGGTLDAITISSTVTVPDALVIVAAYSGDQMAGLKILSLADGTIPVGLNMDSGDNAKIFILHKRTLVPCRVIGPMVWPHTPKR